MIQYPILVTTIAHSKVCAKAALHILCNGADRRNTCV